MAKNNRQSDPNIQPTEQQYLPHNESFRRRLNIVVIVFTVFILILLYMDFAGHISKEFQLAYVIVDSLVCMLFLFEYFYKIKISVAPRRYALSHWIDLLASIPFTGFCRFGRLARLTRLARLLRLFRLGAVFLRMINKFGEIWNSRLIKSAGFVCLFSIVFVSVLIMDIERGNPDLNTFSDALWWSVATVTTGGCENVTPQTAFGRVLAVFLIMIGIGMIGAFVASMASYLVEEADEPDEIIIRDKLDALQQEVQEIKSMLQQLGSKNE
ncbi:potassium channel family protein [Planctomycetota bacterium]